MTTNTDEEALHHLCAVCGEVTSEKREAIMHAYRVASHAHQRAVRRSGEPFITHPLAVARIVAICIWRQRSSSPLLLYDVVEDAGYQLSALCRQFGASVAFLVDAVTVPEAEVVPRYLLHTLATHKLLQAMKVDQRVGWLKLADRLHTMRTLQALRPNKQEAIALETLTFYVPFAHHLGAVKIQRELESLADGVLKETLMEGREEGKRA